MTETKLLTPHILYFSNSTRASGDNELWPSILKQSDNEIGFDFVLGLFH